MEGNVSADYRPESLRVIIPVGGVAKRLLPLTAEVSKACIRLVNHPLIEVSLLTLARQGIRNFIFEVKGYTNYKSLHDFGGRVSEGSTIWIQGESVIEEDSLR